MRLGILESLFNNPRQTLIFLLLALPGRLLAISLHEAAHGYVAERCGDPTARMMGRVTINPAKHLDPIGVIMMMLIGIGWAKPVPVNPRNFRNYRKDDLKVSLAGITANLLSFVAGCIVMYLFLGVTLALVKDVPAVALASTDDLPRNFTTVYQGMKVFMSESGRSYTYIPLNMLITNGITMGEAVIEPVLGSIPRYIYEMMYYFTLTSLSLAIFNLIPAPPLHRSPVLTDCSPPRPLFTP
ncbi:MAG: site-2 protease family protein, partial [Clostridia bacterium]|nr:site-2 protease family protein [Clostridia bacterium]